jgi:hypothetical protein
VSNTVLAATVVPDLDTFLGIVFHGTHRAALHTLLIPTGIAILIYYDTRVRERSQLARYGPHATRIAWVCVAAYLFAGIIPDLVVNGVNLLYPLNDRFYTVTGHISISNERGLIQTIWQPASSVGGTTADTHFYTGVDPTRGPDRNVERIFPIANGGMQLLLVGLGVVVSAVRLWEERVTQPVADADA